MYSNWSALLILFDGYPETAVRVARRSELEKLIVIGKTQLNVKHFECLSK